MLQATTYLRSTEKEVCSERRAREYNRAFEQDHKPSKEEFR
jgi:hypothetical protein